MPKKLVTLPDEYLQYLQDLDNQTTLNVSELIRLAVHLAPGSPKFLEIVDQYKKAHKKDQRAFAGWLFNGSKKNLWRS